MVQESHLFLRVGVCQLLFESDLNGLGNPAGFEFRLDDIWLRSFEIFGNSTWWEGNQLMTFKDAQFYFDHQPHDGENCLWLQGEKNQSCAILKIFTVKEILDIINNNLE